MIKQWRGVRFKHPKINSPKVRSNLEEVSSTIATNNHRGNTSPCWGEDQPIISGGGSPSLSGVPDAAGGTTITSNAIFSLCLGDSPSLSLYNHPLSNMMSCFIYFFPVIYCISLSLFEWLFVVWHWWYSGSVQLAGGEGFFKLRQAPYNWRKKMANTIFWRIFSFAGRFLSCYLLIILSTVRFRR